VRQDHLHQAGPSRLDLARPGASPDAAPFEGDPEARLLQLGERLILDEAQRLPALFPILRGIVDRRIRRRGGYVLLGSASPVVVKSISESLAGRIGLLDLTPSSGPRWPRGRPPGASASSGSGGFPVPFLTADDDARSDWFEAYTRTFIERDLPALGIDVSPVVMRRLWGMLAHANGGLWNASQMAASLGVSYHTVNRYLEILEHLFLIRRLPPYAVNIGKRLVKSPKIYLADTGLLHAILGIHRPPALDVHPARGASWEGFVIGQIISLYGLARPEARAFFWRTARGSEVDLLMDLGDRRVPFEVKLHSSPAQADAASLVACMGDLAIERGYLVHAGSERYSLGRA